MTLLAMLVLALCALMAGLFCLIVYRDRSEIRYRNCLLRQRQEWLEHLRELVSRHDALYELVRNPHTAEEALEEIVKFERYREITRVVPPEKVPPGLVPNTVVVYGLRQKIQAELVRVEQLGLVDAPIVATARDRARMVPRGVMSELVQP